MINWDKIRKPIGKLEKYTLDYNSDDKYNFEHFNCRYNLSTKEKGNIIKVINSCEVLDKGFVREILDHLNMINMVREYYPNEFFSPENEDSFDKHHLSLSKIVNKIKQKTIKTYVYDDNFLNKIEEPIIINGVIFQPLVLKSQEDYSSEGAFMHHCVASYFNSPYRKPLIISLRCNDDADRVTCEYNVVTGNLNQSKSFQNAKPPEYFVEPLDILNERILKVKDKQMLLPVTIISTPNVVNGIEVNESKQQEVVDDIFW